MQQFPVFLKLLCKCLEYVQTVNPTSAVIVCLVQFCCLSWTCFSILIAEHVSSCYKIISQGSVLCLLENKYSTLWNVSVRQAVVFGLWKNFPICLIQQKTQDLA